MRYAAALLILIFTFLGIGSARAEMVYLYQKGEQRRVALADDQGRLIRLLTPEHLQAYHPEISADGRYVAYSIGIIEPERVEVAVHVLDLQTNEVEVWTPSGNQYIHAEFSGDGEYLAYSGPVKKGDQTRQQIHLIHLPSARAKGAVKVEQENGRTLKYFQTDPMIIDSEYSSYFPALSSDGSFVVYHRTRDSASGNPAKELVLHDFRNRSEKLLTKEGGHAVVPSLSWDNRHVAYAAIEEGQWDIHVLDLWTNTDRQITRSPSKEFTPVFAPDVSLTYTHFPEGDSMDLDLYRIPADQVFGGAAVQPVPFIADPDVQEYIPAFSGATWFSLSAGPDLPHPPRSSFGTVAHEGKIYVAGGHQGPEHTYPPESFLDHLDIYDTRTKKWQRGAPLSVPRQGFELIAHEGYLYAFGGFTHAAKNSPPWRSLAMIERYDIARDRWEVLEEKLPRSRSSNIAAKVGNKVYLIGGWDSTPSRPGDKEGRFHRRIDVFDLATLRASATEHELPDPLRRAFTAVVKGEQVWLLGGISPGSSHFDWLDKVTVFTPGTGRWREAPALPFATFAPGAGVYRNTLFLFGGMIDNGDYQNTIYSLDMTRPEKWRNTGRYLKENRGFPMVVDHPEGGLGILGGHTYRHTPKGVEDTPVSTFEHLQ
jgi:hypothetical protein